MKDKLKKVWDAALKNSKYVFPVIVCAAVAITVVIALRAGGVRNEELNQIGETLVSTDTTQQTSSSEANEDAPLVKNENAEIHNLIASYYSALAYGDEATLNSVCDNVEEMEMLWFLETSKYVEYYPELEIYTKPGFGEGETIAYVCFKVKLTGKDAEYPGCTEHYICTKEDGSLYIKRTAMTAEQEEYKNKVGSMADVLELSNRVKVEFDNLMEEQPELLAYMDDVSEEVRRMVGEELSSKKGDPDAGQQTNPDGDGTENGNGGEGNEGGEGNGIDPNTNIEPNVTEVIYAVASTTVNVRKSDSQKAEKIGRLTGGTKVQVLEEMVNGWTKIQFEKQEGYVMSQYLKVQESALKYTPIGKVKATDNINVRADASTDSSKIGTLVKGDEVDLLAVEGEWCKINYKNQTAYVKSEFVEKVE